MLIIKVMNELESIKKERKDLLDLLSLGGIWANIAIICAVLTGVLAYEVFNTIGLACTCVGIVIIAHLIYSYKKAKLEELKERERVFWQEHPGKTLTEAHEDGSYTISSADLFEAVEKLGYLEHHKDPSE